MCKCPVTFRDVSRSAFYAARDIDRPPDTELSFAHPTPKSSPLAARDVKKSLAELERQQLHDSRDNHLLVIFAARFAHQRVIPAGDITPAGIWCNLFGAMRLAVCHARFYRPALANMQQVLGARS